MDGICRVLYVASFLGWNRWTLKRKGVFGLALITSVFIGIWFGYSFWFNGDWSDHKTSTDLVFLVIYLIWLPLNVFLHRLWAMQPHGRITG